MPGLVPGIHVLTISQPEKNVDGRDHRRAEATPCFGRLWRAEATPSFRRLCPAMTKVDLRRLRLNKKPRRMPKTRELQIGLPYLHGATD
jgi:hypothetical protein